MIGEAVIEFIVQVFAEVVVVFLFRYPGALVVQAATGFSEPYAYWLDERPELSAWVGVFVAAGSIIVAANA